MSKIRAIGLSGYAGSGKSEAAKYLEKEYGGKRRHVAEPLRAMLRELLRAYKLDENTIWAYLEGPLKEDVIPELGVTSRYAQITLGTEWGRELINDALWSNAWRLAVEAGEIAVNDSVRFLNEAAAIHELDGIVIKIVRPGVGPAKFTSSVGETLFKTFGMAWGVHPSERIDLIHEDYLIVNDGSISDLQEEIDWIMLREKIERKRTGSIVDRLPQPTRRIPVAAD